MFRKLNELEEAALSNLRSKGKVKNFTSKDKKVRYDHKGNFTVCVLKSGASIYTGAAKRNPKDKGNRMLGEMTSFIRALEN